MERAGGRREVVGLAQEISSGRVGWADGAQVDAERQLTQPAFQRLVGPGLRHRRAPAFNHSRPGSTLKADQAVLS